MSTTGMWVDTGFFELFWDAVWFARQSARNHKEDSHIERKLARASVITCALCLECAANCCIDELSGKFAQDADKLPALSKLDVYLLFRKQQPLDRGNKFVQPMKDLMGLRNDYVHRKVTRHESTFIPDAHLPCYTIERGKFAESIGFVADPSVWDAGCAERTLKCLTAFLDFYFLQCCQHTPKQVRRLLYGGPEGFTVISSAKDVYWNPREIKAMQKKGIISLRFVGE
jgi:hypothetical protein